MRMYFLIARKYARNGQVTSCLQLVLPVKFVETTHDLHVQVAMSKRNDSTVARHYSYGDWHRDSVNSRQIVCNLLVQ